LLILGSLDNDVIILLSCGGMAGIPNPTSVPSKVVAGDTLKFKIDNTDFKASDGWTYKIVFTNKDNRNGVYSSSADGDSHQITIEESVTATWNEGDYDYHAYFEHSGGDRWTADTGRFKVKYNLAGTSGNKDLRTHARIALDAIESVLESRATVDQMKFEVAGRTLERTPIDDLLRLREYYRREVRAEARADRIEDGKSTGGRIRVRFLD